MLLLLAACSDYEVNGDPKVSDAQPILQVDPTSIDLGTIPPDCILEDVVTLSNVGDATLHVSDVQPDGTGWSSESPTIDLAPGESTPVRVRFTPPYEGVFPGQLLVHSDDSANPEYPVPLDVTVSATYAQTDTYVQGSTAIDILWVVDNSSSFTQEQTRVAASISTFYDQFVPLDVDYHMGVITTDIVNPVYSGRLVGEPPYLDPSTADGAALLATALQVGNEDMGDESGLAATELALTEPLLSTDNAGFYRDDASLAVIWFSDEPEQSTEDAQHYIDFFNGLKADPTRLSLSAIVGDYGTGCSVVCEDVQEDAQPGDKYIDVANAFGGVVASDCTCDLTEALADIGADAIALFTSFPLSDTPASDTITVYVDASSSSAWSYDASSNTVAFSDPPSEGQTVTITYEVATECPSDATDTGDTGAVDTADTGGGTDTSGTDTSGTDTGGTDTSTSTTDTGA